MATRASPTPSLTPNKPNTPLDMAPAETSTPGSSTVVGSQAPSAATEQVFNTPELLEMVLLRLPTADMMRSRRTQHRFNNTILGSKKLMSPISDLDIARTPEETLVFWISDRFKEPAFPAHLSLALPGPCPYDAAAIGTIHPSPIFETTGDHRSTLAKHSHFLTSTIISMPDANKILRWRSGPWRKHFLAQPSYVQEVLVYCAAEGHGETKMELIRPKQGGAGITLGCICDGLKSMAISLGGRPDGRGRLRLRAEIVVYNFVEEGSRLVEEARRRAE